MKISLFIILISFAATIQGCKTTVSSTLNAETVQVPFLKNTGNECYYLDEFMPVPDAIVSGKTGALNLRYYTYKAASYKDWKGMQISLAFYSADARCWSLFEEYYTKE